MPPARACVSTSAVNGKIYAIGGSPGYGQWYLGLPTVEEYDPATDTWTRKIDIPTARSGLTTSAVNDRIYAIGGWVGSGTAVSTVEEYEPIAPLVVDFSGDETVDFQDFSMLTQYWHQSQSPFVNHRMDYKDLAVLAEYWLQDFRLIAHWKLDETAAGIAYDSIADNEAFGPPDLLWQPQDGKVGGALELDGIDDLLFTTFSLNPADTSFIVFAWVKGGALGQVVISQTGGANWLMADASEGKLMTELKVKSASEA